MIRVLVIDDHALVRTGFRLILSREIDIEVVGEAESGEEGLPLVRKLKPDVVLCDLHLPGVSGLEITERIVQGDYGARVIIVSVQDDGPMPRRLMEAGASGYLGKSCAAEELLRAIRDVSRGKRYIASEMAQKMALGSMTGVTPFDVLSPREFEVAMLLSRGLRPDDIAKLLSVSPKTVATHKTRMFQKLSVQDSIAMSRLALQYGLVDTH